MALSVSLFIKDSKHSYNAIKFTQLFPMQKSRNYNTFLAKKNVNINGNFFSKKTKSGYFTLFDKSIMMLV